jgi:hypothetical protein
MALPGLTWDVCRPVYFIPTFHLSAEMEIKVVAKQKDSRGVFVHHALCEGTRSKSYFLPDDLCLKTCEPQSSVMDLNAVALHFALMMIRSAHTLCKSNLRFS